MSSMFGEGFEVSSAVLLPLDGLVYHSNCAAGLRIIDLDQVAAGTLPEVAFFDTYPEADDARFSGSWSS